MRILKPILLWTLAATLFPHPGRAAGNHLRRRAKAAIQPANGSYRFPNSQTLHYDAEWRLWKAGREP